ncbi:unnamed protein product [Schistosoma margrebowiei]|uniref:Uncharacterized protein n=1 Tax=Schistosoma margrebowiei TaxID=48269 RepID=A0A183MXZ6_9TREM|nr:unnamed protein product [Schistosoma margrebowiei]
MEDLRTRKRADIASDHHLVVANLKLKLKKNWTTGQTALQRFNKTFLRDTKKIQRIQNLTRSTEGRRNYYGGQLERYQRSINIDVSGGIIIYKQLSTQHNQCSLTGYHQQQSTVGENTPTSS